MRPYQELSCLYNDLMRDVDYDMWAAYIGSLLGGKELRIYEAACGTGNITRRLYEMGHDVIASDVSASMLDIAMSEAKKRGQSIVFIQQDMRKIEANGRFDAVISACDGVNYVDLSGLEDFALAAHSLLNKGGRLLFDISSACKLASMHDQVYYDDGDEAACIWHSRFNAESKTLAMDVTLFVRRGALYEKKAEKHIQYAHDIGDVTRIVMAAGFGKADVFKAFTTEKAGHNDERIQFVFHKD